MSRPPHHRKWKPKKTPAPPPALQGLEELAGTIENIVYRSEETGYTVCAVRVQGQKDTITVVGTCAAAWVGEILKVSGQWIRHPQHGYQFQAESMACAAPTSAEGIERFLASGLIRGTGKVMAKRLVEAFGKDTLRIIEKESLRLEEVDGIGEKRRKMIKDSWNEQKAVRDVMIFLQSHGVGTAQAARIFKHYGDDAIGLISENPYRLSRDVWGIGFKSADQIAQSLGVPKDSELRARAGIVYVLETMTDDGHCFSPRDELITTGAQLLEIPAATLERALAHELNRGSLVDDGGRIYLKDLHEAELRVARKLRTLRDTALPYSRIDVDKALPWAGEKMGITFDPKQAEALRMALTEKVSIMTGGPGVGKTTIIRALVDVFSVRKLNVALAAPTGRAAKRMEESTGREARTIHRLLKFLPATGSFEHGPTNPLEHDVVILDEVSMIDVQLMCMFLGALPDHASLVLVGDVDQLPSVGPGNVLRDLIESGKIPCTKLDTVFRQETGGWIVRNAHRVNAGQPLELPEAEDFADFYFIHTQDPDQVVQRVIELVTQRIPERFGHHPMTDIQVLTPMRKNQLGADNLNGVLQEALNPSGPDIQRFGRSYRQRDRVMQIRNNYDKLVFNGDIGLIQHVDTVENRLTVQFDDRRVTYESNELDELVHAYACSVHKAQGSEYPAVVLLMATQHFKLLQRNLLYTALTRGRQLVVLVGSAKAVNMAIRNNEIKKRRTGLKERLPL